MLLYSLSFHYLYAISASHAAVLAAVSDAIALRPVHTMLVVLAGVVLAMLPCALL